ncbi:alkaline phosphatase [Gracilibacillus sp. S3-1-1]|uniref:Alkaline phosphatase n=1 Tax=Gracilibacillus pellucidus TaxID=3095368 RepID=A0ACC6M3A1_9BACI|nr:alkaline phosphatase [Gracilibacillus sp. S3-1-1]MDX8045350.1 alkaline phosphatase [Gracilibacillus sp. S3-1-1]
MDNKFFNGLIVTILSLFVLSACSNEDSEASTDPADSEQKTSTEQAESKNLIVLIGDGMGPPQISLTRLYQQEYHDKDSLALDEILVGTNTTFAGDSTYKGESGVVTDSAAAATAFGTGHKTYNGAISVTNEEVAKPVASIIEAASLQGKATGLISTARITHATPAAYAAHVRLRPMENAIASQYVDAGVDVLLGGGERHFVPSEEESRYGATKREDQVNLIEPFSENGYEVVYNQEELGNAEGDKLLGLFDDSHIPYNLDRGDTTPSLAEQLEKAIEVLDKNDEGFVLMLEGGRIDHAGHANDIHSIIQETIEFDEAVEVALDYAKEDEQTSVMVTADHETGGLTIGSHGIYDVYFEVFKAIEASSELIGQELEEAEEDQDVRDIVENYTGIDNLTDEEVDMILAGEEVDGTPSQYGREGSFNAVIAERSLIGWTGHGHTGVDVNVYAYGPVADLLAGHSDNTDFAKAGAEVVGLDLDAATKNLQEKYLYPKFIQNRDGDYLFPAKALAEALESEIEVNDDASVEIEGETFQGEEDNEEVYLPLEAFSKLTGKDLTWDQLSERIVLP